MFLAVLCAAAVVLSSNACSSEASSPQAAESSESDSKQATEADSSAEKTQADPPLVESGTFTAQGIRLSFIGSGVAWNGVLHYKGASRNFRVTGLGIGGIGVSLDKIQGTVYNMKKIDDFVGAYGNVRAGITIGTTLSDKHIWAENEKHVRIRMKSENQGLQLNLGADALVVTWRGEG
jgi:hypothetical protein